MSEKRNKFNLRGFVAVNTGLSFIGMTITGVILFLTPPGRVANWTGWTMLRLTKDQWGALHIWLSIVFLIASFFHIYFNWRALLNYFRNKITKQFSLRLEWILSVIIFIMVGLGTLYEIKPFSTLMNLNYTIKHSWERKEEKAPIAHAELLTFSELADQIKMDKEIMKANLSAKGIAVHSDSILIGKLAKDNDITPNELYKIAINQDKEGGGRTAGAEQGGGRGFGRKTLEQFCDEEGINVDQTIEKLQKAGIKADKNKSIRQIAEQLELRPSEVAELIRN